jgi:hypothetical protein
MRRNKPTNDHPRIQKKHAKEKVKTPTTTALEMNDASVAKMKYTARATLATNTMIEYPISVTQPNYRE